MPVIQSDNQQVVASLLSLQRTNAIQKKNDRIVDETAKNSTVKERVAKYVKKYALPTLILGLLSYLTKQGTQCRNAAFTDVFPSLKRNAQKEFEYTTRTLDVKAELAKYDIKEKEIRDLKTSLLDGNYKASIFNHIKKVPYIALKAFSDKVIGKEEFTNVMFYWSIRQHHEADEIQVVHLFDSYKTLNSNAADALLDTFSLVPFKETHMGAQVPASWRHQMPKDTMSTFLDKSAKKEFLDRLEKLPKSAQTFFVFPDIQAKFKNDGLEKMMEQIVKGQITISQEIQKSSRINIFNRIEMDGTTQRITPSFEMMQEAVNLMGKENAVTITTTVGLSSLKDIRQNGLSRERDMGIPFPEVELPQKADNFRCTEGYDFFYHDFYHAIQASYVPVADRERFIRFSDLVKETRKSMGIKEEILSQYTQELRERILDMEHPAYNSIFQNKTIEMLKAQGLENAKDYIFFQSIDVSATNTFNRIALKISADHHLAGKVINSLGGSSEVIENISTALACSGFPAALAKNVVRNFTLFAENQISWCKKFIEYGTFTEKLLSQIALISGEPISDLSRLSFMIQGKLVCQNPWLLT